MEIEKIRQDIRDKLDIIDSEDGRDINLLGESEDYIQGFRMGLSWVLDDIN